MMQPVPMARNSTSLVSASAAMRPPSLQQRLRSAFQKMRRKTLCPTLTLSTPLLLSFRQAPRMQLLLQWPHHAAPAVVWSKVLVLMVWQEVLLPSRSRRSMSVLPSRAQYWAHHRSWKSWPPRLSLRRLAQQPRCGLSQSRNRNRRQRQRLQQRPNRDRAAQQASQEKRRHRPQQHQAPRLRRRLRVHLLMRRPGGQPPLGRHRLAPQGGRTPRPGRAAATKN
mmetsp:Transcript_25666/g.64653  ORF Transcript_25666/g.64653 Transcript_25666/m.64653 type:complete len:223 (+) Transcript_25666:769-1437(+)